MSTTPTAYSYIRFSTPEQAEGDSLRRQTDAAAEWCKRHGIHLDTSLSLRDLGKSAYTGEHRKNPDRHALATFLKLVEAGKVPQGSYLVIENLDRLTREDERKALRLWLDILDHGVNIVQLKPETVFRHEKSDMFDIMRAIMELSRGHGESRRKSDLVGDKWAEKRKCLREGRPQPASRYSDLEGKRFLTHALPGWIEERNGKLVLIPERAAVVKRIFQMAAGGYGLTAIVGKLTKDQVPAMGKVRPRRDRAGIVVEVLPRRWVKSYVFRILVDRRALGEYQPMRRPNRHTRVADGEPIPNYFPAVVTEEEFHAARAGASQRKLKTGRVSKRLNVFAHLVKQAGTDDSYQLAMRIERGSRKHHVLITGSASNGHGSGPSFPFNDFETAMLSLLKEVDPREVLGQEKRPDEVMALSGEYAVVEAKIAELEAELLNGDVAALAKVLRQQEARKRELAERLAQARQKAVHPLSESWGEFGSLVDAIAGAPDPEEARLRLRAALRRLVEGIWLLVVPRGRDRLAAVRVQFTGDGCRNYFILSRPPKSNGKATVSGCLRRVALSVALPDDCGAIDLRNPKDARKLEKILAAIDPEEATL